MVYKEYKTDINQVRFDTKFEELEELAKEIEEFRQSLYDLIDMTGDFTDNNIINQSQKLDRLLNDYEELKRIRLIKSR